MFAFFRKRRDEIALYEAIYKGDLQRIKKIVGTGLDLNFVRQNSSPLCQAVWAMDGTTQGKSIVDYLISQGASLKRAGNESLMAGAAIVGDHGLIDLTLAAGHDIHFRPRHGTTPLQAAAFRNKPETMKYLIEKGATKEDFDTIQCAWYPIQNEVIRILLDLGVDVPREAREFLLEDDRLNGENV